MTNALAAGPAAFTALAASAELSSCELDRSASVVHRWLRQHAPHEAVAITAKGSREPLSRWTGPAFDPPAGTGWPSADALRALGRPVVSASGMAAASAVTITVALPPGQTPPAYGAERVLHALARVIAARVGRTPRVADTAPLSIALATSVERTRLTQELQYHFAQDLEAILGHLRDDAAQGVPRAAAEASRALHDLRARRPLWQQARRLDEAFAEVEAEIGELASAAGIRLEAVLAGPPQRIVSNTVLDAASSITGGAVFNVLEHAQAARAGVTWSVTEDELAISIFDDGRGFDVRREARGGLRAMRRCAESLGGALEIDSPAGWGTHLRARLGLQAVSAVGVDESASALVRTLGEREFDVLQLLAVGQRNREIAGALGVSQHTVKFHVAKILQKLHVRTRAEAAAVAFAAGIHPCPRPGASRSDG